MKELNELVEAAAVGKEFKRDIGVKPETIIAIAAEFRALEQRALAAEGQLETDGDMVLDAQESMREWRIRAEAAEAKVKELEQEQAEHDEQIAALQGKFDLALAGLRSKTERCGKAETELEALKKQHPIGRVDRGAATDSNEYPDAHVVCLHEHVGWEAFQDGTELFTRPAPAVSLTELVPDESALADKHIEWLSTLQRPMFSDEDWEELTLYTWLAFRDSARVQRAEILRNIEEAK